jgi:N-acetylmuramoyl-L-alanine amidase
MPRCLDALDRLCTAKAEVSAHYLVEESGKIWQLVPESRRSWHAGRSRWGDATDLNSRSIGIEICNPGHDGGAPPFPRRQIERVAALVADILRRRAIEPARVLAHSDIAPDRKGDPGERFPWGRLARQRLCLAVRPEPIRGDDALSPAESAELRATLARIGYPMPDAEDWDAPARLVLKAFQRRWRRARIDGAPDRSSLVTARRLLRAQLNRL